MGGRSTTRLSRLLQGYQQVENMEKELSDLNKLADRHKSGTNWETKRSIQNKKRDIESLRGKLKVDEDFLEKNFPDDYQDFLNNTTGHGTGIKNKPTARARVLKQLSKLKKCRNNRKIQRPPL